MRKREERLQRRMATLDRGQVLVGVDPSNSMSSTNTNPNWYLKEKSQEELRSPNTLTRVTGNEPFIVGKSLTRYSKELDRSRPSSANRYGRSHSSSEFEWKRGSLPVQQPRTEAPNAAEERMVRLGMIPPRSSYEANGHIHMGYMTAPHPRTKSPIKNVKRRSDGEVLVPLREVELWDSSNPRPFTLPKEDYNTEGITWYRSKSLDGDNLISSTASYNYPMHGPQLHHSQNASGRVLSHPGDVSPTAVHAVREYHATQEPEKLKRVKRVGVPTLPD